MYSQQQHFEIRNAGPCPQLEFPFAALVCDDSWEPLWDFVIRICDRYLSSISQQYAA
jgi:hypothetical protein